MDHNAPGYKGFKDYSPRFLKTYDKWVLGFMAPRVWKTGAEPAIEVYRRVGRRHLDVGPGTGYLIIESDVPKDVELTLVDANPNVLEHCAVALADWDPVLIEANILEPLPVDGPFDSVALAHVLHCLPGPMAAKARVIETLAAVMTGDGVLFGGTVLGLSERHSWAARTFLRLANLQGGFDNRDDTEDGLRSILEASFAQVEIEVIGSIAYFAASLPLK